MIDKKRIEEEAEHFFGWPTAAHSHVTRTSMLIFANVIVEMVRAEATQHAPGELCPACAAAEFERVSGFGELK